MDTFAGGLRTTAFIDFVFVWYSRRRVFFFFGFVKLKGCGCVTKQSAKRGRANLVEKEWVLVGHVVV